MKIKREYEVDLLVALFITKEVEADSEDEAIEIAEGRKEVCRKRVVGVVS